MTRQSKAFTPFEASITEISAALGKGLITSEELVSYYLKRIRVYDKFLHSVININPMAIEEARALDLKHKRGESAGCLHGIPIVIKDNCEAVGMPTTNGSRALKDFYSPRDSFVVKKLKEAGAVILGKSSLTEFTVGGMGYGTLNNQTLNPYDLTRTAGGSSSGSGCAVGADFAAGAIGTDTVNSLRSPASACSIAALRPTRGLIGRTGIFPHTPAMDCAGPMCKYVSDIAVMLNALVGFDPDDEQSAEAKDVKPEDYTLRLNKNGLKGKRLGLLVNNLGSDADVTRVLKKAVEDIKSLGAEIIDIDEKNLLAEDLLASNKFLYFASREDTEEYIKQLQGSFPYKNIQHMVEENKGSGNIAPGAYNRFSKLVELNISKNSEEYIENIEKNNELRAFILKLMDDNNLDGIIYPLQTILVVKPDNEKGQSNRNGIIAAKAGLPALTVPMGFSAPASTAEIGVPIGLDIMGRPFDEGNLIEMGYAYEQATKHRVAPNTVPNLDFSSVE